tara:strand:+ start:13681 stop:20262 length:6582 start_codon:yes stop_codon:yes gene_type:complete
MKGILCFIISSCFIFNAVSQNSPVLEAIDDLTLPEGMVYELTFGASDPDPGDSLTFEVLDLPYFATFSESTEGTGNISIQSGFSDAGQYTITVRVYDESLNSDEDSFLLTIEENTPKASTQELLNFNYSINAGGTLDYYVYYPLNYDAYPNDQPVLIYLHGLGMRGGSPTKLISAENDGAPSHYVENGGDLPMMVVTPHQPVWIGGVSYSTWNIPLVKELVEHIKTSLNVDQDRIYLTGFSNGGQSAWQYAIEYKEDLAALIPVAGRTNLTNQSLYGMNLQDPEYACQISDLPINVWHSFNDEVINIGHATSMVESINNCIPAPDPTPQLHILSGVSHGGTRPAVYGNISGPDNIYNWMLSYVRGVGFTDTDPPVFVNGTPSVDNLLDVSFDLNIDLDEVGTVYYALYGTNITPTAEDVITGSGSSIISFGSVSNMQSSTKTISGLAPETTYYLWMIAEDVISPANRQAEPTGLVITTSEEIIDDQPPIYEQTPLITELGAGSIQFEVDIDEEGEIYWGIFHPTVDPDVADLLNNQNGILFGNQPTDGSPVLFNSIGLFRNTSYRLGILAVDNEEEPNIQSTVYIIDFVTDSLEEGVIPDRKYLLNITKNASPSNEFGWNDLGFDGFNGSKIFNGLKDDQEQTGSFQIITYNGEEGSSINSVADNGSGYGSGSTFPAEVVRYGAYTTGMGIIDFKNLDPDKYYSFNILGSRNTSGSRTTNYTIDSETHSQESVNNLSSTISFVKITPASNGEIRLSFAPGSSNWGYINLIEIEEYNQLSGDTVPPILQPGLTALQIDDNEVEITWTGSFASDLAGYTLYRSLSPEPSSDLLADILIANASGISFLDSTVVTGQQYYYWLMAIDSAGNYSSISSIDSIFVIANDTIAPQPPTGLIAVEIGTQHVNLAWNSNPESDILGYQLARGESVDFDFESGIIAGPIDETMFLDSLLADQTTYYYKAKAIDLSGNRSIESEALSITTLDGTPPALPDSLFLVPGTTAIEVRWLQSISTDVAGYNLFRSIEADKIVFDSIGSNPIIPISKNIWLPFESNLLDASGNAIISSSGGGMNYISGNIIEGIFAAQFDGVDDIIALDEGDAFIHQTFTSKTISMWVNANTTAGLIDIYDEGGSTNGIGIRLRDGLIEGVVQDNHVIEIVEAPIDTNTWTHVALVFDQSILSIYLNGVLMDLQVTPFASVGNHSDAGGLGGTNGSNAFDTVGNNFSGFIDEFMVFPLALDSNTLKSYHKYYHPAVDIISVPVDSLIAELSENDTVFVDDSLQPGVEYGYFLSVVDTSGNKSGYTSPVFGQIDFIDPPQTPQNLQVVLSGANGLQLGWDAVPSAGFSHYTLYRSIMPFTSGDEADYVLDSISVNDHLDVSLQGEYTYYYRVSAVNVSGDESELSDMVSYTIPDTQAPLAPINTTVVGDTDRISLIWENGGSMDVSGYNIYRNTGSAPLVDSAYLYAQELGSSFIDMGVLELSQYFYMVTAFDEVFNESEPGNVAFGSPLNVTPPSAPVGVTALLIDDTEISLTWDENMESDLFGYRVYRGLDPEFIPFGNKVADSLTEASFVDSGLEAETEYFYYITAIDVNGNESLLSLLVSTTTNQQVEFPETPQNLQALLSGTEDILLTWDNVTSTGISHYGIYRATTPFDLLSEATYIVDSVFTTDYMDMTLEEEVTYYYRVSSKNVNGEESLLSDMVSYTIPDSQSPLAPINITAHGDTSMVVLGWEDGGSTDVVGFNIYRNVGAVPLIDSTSLYAQVLGTSFTDSGVDELAEYYYLITAFDEANNESVPGNLVFSSPLNITPPSAPDGVSALLTGDTEIMISWDANTEPDLFGYRVYRGFISGFSPQGNLLVDSLNDISYTDGSLEHDVQYYYYVTAVDVQGNESLISLEVNAITNSEPISSDIVETVMVNLTETGANSGDPSWNDLAVESVDKFMTFLSLTDSLGSVTPYALTVYNGQLGSTINNIADNGSDLDDGIYPDQVSRFGAYTTNFGVMILENLDVNHTYDISLLSGRSGSGSRITTFDINQTYTQSIESINNRENIAFFESVEPLSNGTIMINFSKNNSNWGYLNAIVIHKHESDQAGARVAYSDSENVTLSSESNITKSTLEQEGVGVMIYPNPVISKFEVQLTKPLEESSTLVIRNLQGQALEEFYLQEGKSHFQFKLNYPSGVYHLTIQGSGISVRKMILVE